MWLRNKFSRQNSGIHLHKLRAGCMQPWSTATRTACLMRTLINSKASSETSTALCIALICLVLSNGVHRFLRPVSGHSDNEANLPALAICNTAFRRGQTHHVAHDCPHSRSKKKTWETHGNAAATQSQTCVPINCCSLTDAAAAAKTAKKLDTTIAQSTYSYYQSLFALFVVSLGVITK